MLVGRKWGSWLFRKRISWNKALIFNIYFFFSVLINVRAIDNTIQNNNNEIELFQKRVNQATERDIKYQAIMRNLVRRYITQVLEVDTSQCHRCVIHSLYINSEGLQEYIELVCNSVFKLTLTDTGQVGSCPFLRADICNSVFRTIQGSRFV